MKVKIREKQSKDGGSSLYLDIYARGQKRKYEFLGLKLVKPRTTLDRDLNKQTKIQAEAIRAKRQLELQSAGHGLQSQTNKKLSFLEHFSAETEVRYNSGVDYSSWLSTLKHLKTYIGDDTLMLHQVDDLWLEDFKKYLLHEAKKPNQEIISRNTAHHYFNRVLNCLKEAHRRKLISENPTIDVEYINKTETKKEFLTFEEVQLLAKTKCRYEVMKNAFLFSCLSGMRFGDIETLTWSEVRYSEANSWGIYFTQNKTDGVEFLPITDQARTFLPTTPGKSNDKVFVGLKYSGHYNDELLKWVRNAGITKHITFHCGRHTAATLLLSNNVDIYTVSKILGHKDIKTTEVYAKLVSSKRIEAVNKIPQLEL